MIARRAPRAHQALDNTGSGNPHSEAVRTRGEGRWALQQNNDPGKRMVVKQELVPVRGTTLAVDIRGAGPPLLLIHGGGEDASMLASQADDLARAGYRVLVHDRRGTGRSGRENWPGAGAQQHADDAAELIRVLGLDRTTAVGVSSGAVIALALSARHPKTVERVVAWEPPALGLMPGSTLAQRGLMAPVRRHLRKHPGDYPGAQAILLELILGVPVSTEDPAFAATRANAEAMIRDEPNVPVFRLRRSDLHGVHVTVGIGSNPGVLIKIAAWRLSTWTHARVVRAKADHEAYLSDPTALTEIVLHGRQQPSRTRRLSMRERSSPDGNTGPLER